MKPVLYTADIAKALWAGGWVAGDWHRDISDRPIQGLVYVTRTYEGQHQYLSLCTGPWENAPFLEGVLLVYEKPLDTRARKRQIPLFATIVRGGLEDILAVVNRVYVHLFTPPHP